MLPATASLLPYRNVEYRDISRCNMLLAVGVGKSFSGSSIRCDSSDQQSCVASNRYRFVADRRSSYQHALPLDTISSEHGK
ncbi:hypothetical protein GCK32_021130 [Trichostrongylus colubriformis]|uniref:Uncharacterized protein n=1 Tax=Trichostrongylus colubriformis TaxID=6319 RepID=A0AAN8FZ64_TRICO